MTETGRPDRVMPLVRSDPPRLGDITLSGRLEVTDAGIVYAGLIGDQPVAVALLTEGAETDSYARARFHDAVHEAKLSVDEVSVVASEEDSPEISPWVAVRAESWDDGAKIAGALLAPVLLEHLPSVGPVRGPGFRPHWFGRSGPGRWRAWPLPWPAALSAVGRWTYVASFALVLAIASIALFIAVKVFQDLPPAPVNPPFPAPTQQPPSQQSPSPTPTPTPPTSPQPTRPGGTVTTIPPIV
jgi:hypothetical protein